MSRKSSVKLKSNFRAQRMVAPRYTSGVTFTRVERCTCVSFVGRHVGLVFRGVFLDYRPATALISYWWKIEAMYAMQYSLLTNSKSGIRRNDSFGVARARVLGSSRISCWRFVHCRRTSTLNLSSTFMRACVETRGKSARWNIGKQLGLFTSYFSLHICCRIGYFFWYSLSFSHTCFLLSGIQRTQCFCGIIFLFLNATHLGY